MRLHAAALSDPGRVRRTNQDSLALAPEWGLLLVADGVGGQPAGDVASQLAAAELSARLQTPAADPDAAGRHLLAAVQAANRQILAQGEAQPNWRGMATTLTVAWLQQEVLQLAWLGDSRAYLLRAGRLCQLSRDHTLREERRQLGGACLAGEELQHVITRALGVTESPQVDQLALPLQVGDRLLLCTDGLTGPVADAELEQELARRCSPRATCRALVALANRCGGPDNISVIVADVQPGGALRAQLARLFGRGGGS